MDNSPQFKSDLDERSLPSIFQAHAFVCRCFGISEKELDQVLQRVRKNTPAPDKHFPRQWSRMLPKRAGAKKSLWREAVLTIQREALYERILRENGKPLFSFTGKITEEIVFSLLRLYEKILPKLDAKGVVGPEALWILVENVFLPTVFIKLVETHSFGLGAEFQGDNCWYLPVQAGADKMKPIPRVLEYWFRTSALSTGYRASHRFASKSKIESEQISKRRDSLRKRFDRWRSGEDLPTLFDLHKFVDEAATEVAWLDDAAAWKARFTLANAMQNVCVAMDDLFKNINMGSSLKLSRMIKSLTKEGIVCDTEKFLARSHIFFASRLWQIKLKRDHKWEKTIALPPDLAFPEFTSVEADEQHRQRLFRQMNPGNRLLDSITSTAVSDGVPVRNLSALDDYIFELGVSELNRLLANQREKTGKRLPAGRDRSH